MNQVSSQAVFVELVEVEISEFVVADVVGKHVIDGHEDFMGHRHHGPLVPAPSFETVKFVPQVSALGAASTRAVFRYTLPLVMRLLLRLPADSLLPGQMPDQEASWETLSNTFMSTPSSAIITAASVQSTP